MKSIWLKLARIAFALVLILAAIVLVCSVRRGVETDLYSLFDASGKSALSILSSNLGEQVRVLLEGDTQEALIAPSEQFRRLLSDGAAETGTVNRITETIRWLDGRKSGLLSGETRRLLIDGKGSEVARASVAALFGGLVTPLFPVKKDPFLLATDFVTQIRSRDTQGWTLRDGDLVADRDGHSYRLLTGEKLSSERIEKVLSLARSFSSGGTGVRAFCSGAPFHSFLAMASSKREINVLSLVSLSLVILLGMLLFRSANFVFPLVCALVCAFLTASASLFAVFERPHLLTFVFGTSLIGLSVDYSYHYLIALKETGDGNAAFRKIGKALTFSFLTTIACLAPLLFSVVSVLRQMALFTVLGVMSVFCFVTLFYPCFRRFFRPDTFGSAPSRLLAFSHRFFTFVSGTGTVKKQGTGVGARVFRTAVYVVVFAAFIIGIGRLKFCNDVSKFYKPDSFLAAGEKKFYDLNQASSLRFVLVPGTSVQDALEREEAAQINGLSAVIPSLKRQKENARLIRRLYQEEGSAYTAKTGIPVPVNHVSEGFLDLETVTDPLLLKLVRPSLIRLARPEENGTTVWLVSPASPNFSLKTPGLFFFSPKESIIELFDKAAGETYRLLGLSFIALCVILFCLFGRRALFYVFPIVLAIGATLGTLGWLGESINFFHALCFFVLTGLGLDYTIFHHTNSDEATKRAVLFSFLTSFAGLGLLAFTSFAVTRSMGLTLGLGLFFAYLFSLLGRAGPLGTGTKETSGTGPTESFGTGTEWATQREQSAGRLRMLFMWYLYRFLGKNVQKIVCVPVVACIYPFAGPAKKALREFYEVWAQDAQRTAGVKSDMPKNDGKTGVGNGRLFRHLLGFAWSLADKTDACAFRKNVPKMNIRQDDGGRAFEALIQAKQGAFLISTHLGTVEVLPALQPKTGTGSDLHVHAFQQMGHDAVFTRVFTSALDARRLTLHPVETVGVETAVKMQEAIRRGELVLMAGDRLSAGTPGAKLRHAFLGRPCVWPKGVFTFAKLMESPVFFVTCVRTGWNAYEVHFEKFTESGRDALLDRYVRFLEKETRARPDQWYQFYRFFS